jgi:GR25 family glycosyltransferase involved in LPS biosynthesis
MKIFVIHYKKLVDRKNHMLKQFEKYNITDYEFIEIDRDELQKYDLSIFEKNISNPYKAIFLSHCYAYNQIKDNYNEALIFEDDVILSDNFINILNNYLKELPPDYDMCFLGSCCNLNIPRYNLIPNKKIYKKCLEASDWGGLGSTRALYCYLVSKNCAIKICEYVNNINYKINIATDQWVNIVAKHINLKMYWAEPTIAIQGSENGLFNKSYELI